MEISRNFTETILYSVFLRHGVYVRTSL